MHSERLQDISSKRARLEAGAKEDCCLVIGHKWRDWPCIICDEDMASNFFKTPWPQNARQANGMWPEDCPKHDREYPVMCLGTHEFLWATEKRLQLQPYDENHALAMKALAQDTKLKLAWSEVISRFNLGYWKAKLSVPPKQRDASQPRKSSKRKRKHAGAETNKKPKAVFPQAFLFPLGNNEGDDSESDLFRPKKPKLEPKENPAADSVPSEDRKAFNQVPGSEPSGPPPPQYSRFDRETFNGISRINIHTKYGNLEWIG